MSLTQPFRLADPVPYRDLGKQYRAIGIGAVAAALRYRGAPKNDAYAPARLRGAEPVATDDRKR